MICPTSSDLKKFLIQLNLDPGIVSNLTRVKPDVRARKIGNYLLIEEGSFYHVYVLSNVDVKPVQLNKLIQKTYKNWTINSYYQPYYSIGQSPKTPRILGRKSIRAKPPRSSISKIPGVDYYTRARILEAFFIKGVSSFRYASLENIEVDRIIVKKDKFRIEVTSNAENTTRNIPRTTRHSTNR